MTYFYACVGCKRKPDCGSLACIRHVIKGFGFTSVKHMCKLREPMFEYGDQVLVNLFMYSHGGDEYGSGSTDVYGSFRGVYLDQKGPKGLCFVPPGALRDGGDDDNSEDHFKPTRDGNGYVKVSLSRIRAIEGAERLSPVDVQKILPKAEVDTYGEVW